MYMIPTEGLREFGRHRGMYSSILGLESEPETLLTEVSDTIPVKEQRAGTGTKATGKFIPLPVPLPFEPGYQEVAQLLNGVPKWERRLEQIVEQIVEVQADVLGLKKGFHQHLSKVEGRVNNLQQGFSAEMRMPLERFRQSIDQDLAEIKNGLHVWQQSMDTVFDDLHSTMQQVAASQSDAEMRQAFVHKLSVDNQTTMGEVKKVMVEVNEAVEQVINNQQQSAEAVDRRLGDVKASVDGVRRTVDRTNEMIIKWRQKILRENNNRGVKGWLSRLWNRSTALND